MPLIVHIEAGFTRERSLRDESLAEMVFDELETWFATPDEWVGHTRWRGLVLNAGITPRYVATRLCEPYAGRLSLIAWGEDEGEDVRTKRMRFVRHFYGRFADFFLLNT